MTETVSDELREILNGLDYYIMSMPLETPIQELRYEVTVKLKDALFDVAISIEQEGIINE